MASSYNTYGSFPISVTPLLTHRSPLSWHVEIQGFSMSLAKVVTPYPVAFLQAFYPITTLARPPTFLLQSRTYTLPFSQFSASVRTTGLFERPLEVKLSPSVLSLSGAAKGCRVFACGIVCREYPDSRAGFEETLWVVGFVALANRSRQVQPWRLRRRL